MTEVRFLDLRRETESLRGELDAVAGAVLDRGLYVLGPEVDRFENAFADWCGARFVVGVGSGTAAISLALQAVGVEAGDEVVIPANTCVPTAVGVERAGAVAVLADVDERTRTLSAESFAAAVSPRTRAVLPVHLYGHCADMDAITAVARERGLRVVEDAAQAHGAEYGGRRAGTLGDAAAFSFYPTKNLGALGDAGAVVTDDEEVAARVRRARSYGYSETGEAVEPGWNSRLDELQAALLAAKLERLDGWNERRVRLAERYASALADCDLDLPQEAEGTHHAWHLYVVRAAHRDELRKALRKRGIETLVHYPTPIHRHPIYRRLAREPGELAVSERLAAEVLSLPFYPELTDEEVDAVAAALEEALRDKAVGRSA